MDLQKLVGGPLKVERVIANRPRLGPIGSYVTTPSSARMMELLGVGATSKAVALSKSELEAIRRMYDVSPEESPFTQAGTDRNTLRHAECDGLRMLAWISRFMDQGDDPVRTLVQIAVEAGLDVSAEDFEWADG